MVGCFLESYADINDMTSHTRSLLWWGLEDLGVGVVDPVPVP